MKKGIAKPQPNNGVRLTIPVKTRSPLEAFVMLKVGQPIDQAIGYYGVEDLVEKDFFFMDQVEKLHKLAEYRQRIKDNQSEIDSVVAEFKNNQNQNSNEQEVKQPDGPAAAGPVPE